MTEAYGATNCTMMEVGVDTSSMMKVSIANALKVIVSGNLIISVIIDVIRYIS